MIFAIGLACLAAGALIGFAAHQAAEKKKYKNARTSAETVLVETKRKAEQTKREIVAEGKEEVQQVVWLSIFQSDKQVETFGIIFIIMIIIIIIIIVAIAIVANERI